jgi:hypothetical protein
VKIMLCRAIALFVIVMNWQRRITEIEN